LKPLITRISVFCFFNFSFYFSAFRRTLDFHGFMKLTP